jgi:excisionase family DNA binding protein
MKSISSAKAAEILGCTSPTVRRLVESGRLKGRRVQTETGVQYEISRADAERLKKLPQLGRGFRRGYKRIGPRGPALTKEQT